MHFSPPSRGTVSPLFNPKDEHEIIVARAKGNFAIGYMDKVDPANAHVRIHVVSRTPEGEWGVHGASWVNAADIQYKVASLDEGELALAELRASASPPAKRVWLRGCPWQGPTNAGEITPAEANMTLAKEFFGIEEGLAVGQVTTEMMDLFVEKLDTYFVREVAYSVNQDANSSKSMRPL